MNGQCDVETCNIKAVVKLKNGKEYCPFHLEDRVEYHKHMGKL
jgi:hypothetical protein